MALLEKVRKPKEADAGPSLAQMKRETFVPRLPSVNLLGPEVQEAVELRRLRGMLMVAAAALVGIIAAVWIAQTGLIFAANRALDHETERQGSLNAEMGKLAPIATYYAAIDANQTAIQTTMAKEAYTSAVARAMRDITPQGLSIDSMTVSVDAGAPVAGAPTGGTAASTAAGQCPNPDPFNQTASVGCVSVDGIANSSVTIAAWIAAAEKNPLFSKVFVPTYATDEQTGEVTFSASVALSEKVYSNRYKDLNFLKGTPAAAAPDATTESAPTTEGANQ